MSRNRSRRKPVAEPTPFEQARDELFQHIIRCGVLQATPEHQGEWFEDTIAYTAERFPELTPADLAELRTLGERFCAPPKSKVTEESDAASAA